LLNVEPVSKIEQQRNWKTRKIENRMKIGKGKKCIFAWRGVELIE